MNVIQAITTPTFLTLFLDDVPATMSWEIELNNTITSESRIIRVPQDTLSRTRYIAMYVDILFYNFSHFNVTRYSVIAYMCSLRPLQQAF